MSLTTVVSSVTLTCCTLSLTYALNCVNCEVLEVVCATGGWVGRNNQSTFTNVLIVFICYCNEYVCICRYHSLIYDLIPIKTITK